MINVAQDMDDVPCLGHQQQQQRHYTLIHACISCIITAGIGDISIRRVSLNRVM